MRTLIHHPTPLRIALHSHAFYPAIGGVESVSMVLASEFARMGHAVTVITPTPAGSDAPPVFSFDVLRHPSRRELWRAVASCDVYFQNNISLPQIFPVFLLGKPWVVAHQTWLRAVDGSVDCVARLKRFLEGFASASISISGAIAAQFSSEQTIIGNPYDAVLFRELPDVDRVLDLVFVGRLVSDKGVDILLEALSRLRERNLRPKLTIIGGGPEDAALRALCARLALDRQVVFAGPKRGTELVRLLNAHRIMVVPSRWDEPYGIVALEGIATGNVIVGSAGGGLVDAIGGCGVTFPNGDAEALAGQIEILLTQPDCWHRFRACAPAHLERQSPQRVAEAYIEVFRRVLRTR